jgi:hypothetical protein
MEVCSSIAPTPAASDRGFVECHLYPAQFGVEQSGASNLGGQ